MTRLLRLLAVLLALGLPGTAPAESVVLGLSSHEVEINTTFTGSRILIFGAVKRDAPPPSPQMDVIVTVEGPAAPVTIRRKSHEWGIWVNTDRVRIPSAPSFYAVATTRPLNQSLTETEDLRYKISLDKAIRTVGIASKTTDPADFVSALIRLRQKDGHYQIRERTVSFDQQTLFRTSVGMPSNLTEGTYKVRIFLTRQGQVIDHYETTIDVKKVGMERWLYNLAQKQAFWYGMLSLVLAVAAGWAASAVFTLIRR